MLHFHLELNYMVQQCANEAISIESWFDFQWKKIMIEDLGSESIAKMWIQSFP